MALKKNKLLEALDELRDIIKEEERLQKGRAPLVCNDDTLKAIATARPLKVSDFLAIPGVGRVFMDRYASRFLAVVQSFQSDSVREVKVSKTAYKVLDHYKDRLTNISRRNPNLYMGKTVKRRSFDLAALGLDMELIRFLTNKRTTTLPLRFEASYDGELKERHVTTLYRETNKDEKETGSYDLYIAYPYVEGVFARDSFAIKAPLLYFPVKLVREGRDFKIVKDKDKDILYNRDLLLATSKMEQSDVDSNAPFLSEFDLKTLQTTVIPFYANNGINITKDHVDFTFEPYPNLLKDQFVKRRRGQFAIKEYVTIGRYKLYSSMIQKDMTKILEASRYNDLLEGLIEESHLYDKEKDVVYQIDSAKVDETRLSYINELNYAQEKVIDLVNDNQKLVIWGPPGTGKSQTITSLIASAVLKGENVLVVSEKKVALDVIYSRLKGASRYAMFIDDADNKQEFYQKLAEFLSPIPPQRTMNNDVYRLEEDIAEILETMDKSLDLLYNHTIQDVPMHRLYERYVKDKDVIQELTPKRVHKMFLDTFGTIVFDDLAVIEKTFGSRASLRDYLGYQMMLERYPLLAKLETKISRSNRIEFQEFDEAYQRLHEDLKHTWIFGRGRKKRAFMEQHKKAILYLTRRSRIDRAYFKLLFKDPTLHRYLVDNLAKLHKLKRRHDDLSANERLYLNMLLHHPKLAGQDDVASLSSYLFDALYTGYLEDFRANNQQYLYIFDNYRDKQLELEHLIQDKHQVTIESFAMELYKHALNFTNSRRIMDIKRVLETNRKPSVKAFIDIFQVELMNNIRVWMMTPEVVSAIIPLVYGMFDLVIFDEASQMYVEKGIPAIYRAKKVIIAGDTKQLRPSSLGIGRLDDEDEYFEDDVLGDISMDAKSLLDLARYRYDETILNYHYRSQYEELIAFSNYAFYEGKLIVSPNQSISPTPPIEYVHVKDGTFIKRRNEVEAAAVIRLLRKIFREREHNETIGVITFNSTQRDEIENKIDEELFKRGKYQKLFETELFRKDDGEDKSLFVKNIENVQGDERDIIIFSMGYGRDESGVVHRRFGWLNNDGGQNRLNVAISRAKKKIYFVSSLHPEELKVEDLKSTGPKLLKDYMRYCYYVSNGKSDMARQVLQDLHKTEQYDTEEQLSNLVQDVKRRLERGNYEVRTSIGIGKYSINLALYDPATDTYKLGVICDVDPFGEVDARRDLFHQEKYLRARNWTVYRVFAANWYTDANQEMRNIRELLKE